MHAGWLGIFALGVVAIATAVWFRAARAVRLPASRTPFVVAWLGGALLGAVALTGGAGWFGGIAAALAVAAGATLSLLVAISGQAAAADAIRVGESLRPFTALDDRGEPYGLTGMSGHPVLLKFFRGHW